MQSKLGVFLELAKVDPNKVGKAVSKPSKRFYAQVTTSKNLASLLGSPQQGSEEAHLIGEHATTALRSPAKSGFLGL
jgi:hypothetical protein